MTYKSEFMNDNGSLERKAAVNVGQGERIASTIGGGALIGYALASRSKLGMFLGLFGAPVLSIVAPPESAMHIANWESTRRLRTDRKTSRAMST